jgi:S1-C subfamily serine protease
VVKPSVATMLMLLGLPCAAPQAPLVQVNTHVVLVDKDLNQKPVPHFTIVLTSLSGTPPQATTLKTGFDGKAEAKLPAGKYKLTTPEPVSFQGKRYLWQIEVLLSGSAQAVELSNDNASVTADAAVPSSGGGDLTALFDRLKNSVVTVRAEAKDGSGFLVDPAGLIVTNNHIIESSDYIAVQFDKKRKVAARLLVADANKDVAVLWANLSIYPQAVVAPLVTSGSSGVEVGERVFTIGNPLGRERVLTTGVISKVETDAITSDININPGNSGGPLFTLQGQVSGITTAGLRNLAKIVPIETARALIEQARAKTASNSPPPAELLPVEPEDYFPADSLRALLQQEKLDTKPYFFDAGEFHVGILTPVVSYFLRHEDEMAAARKSAKRGGGDASQAKPPAAALQDAEGYRPVLIVSVRPKLGTVWKVRFKNGFQRMRLLCGNKEMTPVDPGRRPYDLVDYRGRAMDTTFQGTYLYLLDVVSPACGGVVLEIFSEKDPNHAITKVIEPETIERVWADWEPYRRAHAASTAASPQKN